MIILYQDKQESQKTKKQSRLASKKSGTQKNTNTQNSKPRLEQWKTLRQQHARKKTNWQRNRRAHRLREVKVNKT